MCCIRTSVRPQASVSVSNKIGFCFIFAKVLEAKERNTHVCYIRTSVNSQASLDPDDDAST